VLLYLLILNCYYKVYYQDSLW